MDTAHKTETKEVEQILAEMRPLYRELSDLAARASAIGPKLRGFETQLVTLLNWEEGYTRRAKAMETELANSERAAKQRLSTIEHGHKTLIDDLSRKQLEADKAKADAEALNRRLLEERAELVSLKDHYERKLAEINEVAPKRAAK